MTTKLTTKELRTRLKAAVKTTMAKGRQLRLDRHAAGAAGDRAQACCLREEQVHDYRPRARALFLAYAFLKGRTYHQVEGHCAEDNKPHGFLSPLVAWDGDADLIHDWMEAGDKTRFELEAYAQHKQGLYLLHKLIRTGEGDGEKADAIRETFDDSWGILGPQDQDALNNLSGDLYEVTDEELDSLAPSEYRPVKAVRRGFIGRLRHAVGV